MQVWQMVRASWGVCQRFRKLCRIYRISNTGQQKTFELYLLTMNISYSEYTVDVFLLQAENIYNDEDPEGAADSEIQA